MEDTMYWKNRPVDDERVDWRTGGDWITEYWNSQSHPHRDSIINALKGIKFESLLEIGCSCGPNLARILKDFPNVKLSGIDTNNDLILKGKKELPNVHFKTGDIRNVNLSGIYDVILVDAVLMYISAKEITKVLRKINRASRRMVIIVDWYDESFLGVIKDHHWCRNYPELLGVLGFSVTTKKLTEKEWPSQIWTTNGCVFVGKRSKDLGAEEFQPEEDRPEKIGLNTGGLSGEDQKR